MNKWHFILAAAVLLFAACKKSSLKTRIEAPVFKISCNFSSGDSIGHIAGLNDIYHFTRVEDEGDFWRSINAFSETDCPDANCNGNFQVEYLIAADSTDPILQGQIPFAQPNNSQVPTGYNVEFTWADSLDYEEQRLYINDVQYSFGGTGTGATIYYPVSEVVFQATAFNQVRSSTTQLINWSDPETYPTVQLSVHPLGNDQYLIQASLSDTIDVTVFWRNSSTTELAFTTDSLLSQYEVFVFKSGQLVGNASLSNLPSSIDFSLQTAGYIYDTSAFFDLPAASVALQYIDREGQLWRSDWGQQPSSFAPWFRVFLNDPWEDNENGIPNRKLLIDFNCTLFNLNGEPMKVTGNGVSAMAIQ